MLLTQKVRAPRDPSHQNFIMAEKSKQQLVNIPVHKAQEFWEKLPAEISNTCSISSTLTLDLLEPIFTHCILNIFLDFQHFYNFSLFQGLDPNLSFMEAAIALWEWKEGSSQEKVSYLYSLHALDFYISFKFINYIIA